MVLYEPYESAPPPECPICLQVIPRGELLELKGCHHGGCKGCMLLYAAHRWKAGEAFSCPSCRGTESVGAAELCVSKEQIGLPKEGKHIIHFLEDCFHNWHCYGAEHSATGELFLPKDLKRPNPRIKTYTKSATCWISPYSGWIVPNGEPSKNARFQRINVKNLLV